MREIKLKVISPPPEGSCAVLALQKDFKIKGDGDTILFCGSCGNILAEKIFFEQCKNMVIRCRCGAYNVVPSNWSIFRLIDIRENWRFSVIFFGFIIVIISGVVGNIWNWQIGIVLGAIGTFVLLFTKKKTKILSG